jgi:hypothetical protein
LALDEKFKHDVATLQEARSSEKHEGNMVEKRGNNLKKDWSFA